jgi:hypothetical protein
MKIINEEYFKQKLIEDCRKAKRTGHFNMLKKYFRPEHQQAFKRNKVVFVRAFDPDNWTNDELKQTLFHHILASITIKAFDWESYPRENWNTIRYKYLGYGFDYTYLLDMRKDDDSIKYLI